jgi:repressor LexA
MSPVATPTDLTDRQQAVLDYIRSQAAEQGMPPTLQQIATAFGFRQPCAALKHVRRLEEAGYLQVLPNQARGIRLAGTGAWSGAGDRLHLPVLGRVAAGLPIGADAGLQRHVLLDRALFSTRPDYLLRVQGDSMRDEGILDGDLVAVQRTREARNGQVVVARLDGEITIKRFERSASRIRLLPRNPDYAPIVVDAGSDFAIEGLYCGLVRDH